MNWFDIFNTREIALFAWSALLLTILLSKAAARRALASLLMTFIRAKALHQYGAITLLWVAFEILILQWAGLWSLDHLKATTFWVLAVPMAATWRIHQLSQKEDYFVAALRDTFALTVLVEFLVDFYPFPLWAELLIVPTAFGLTLLFEFGKTMDGVDPATKLFGWLLAALGTFVLGHAVYSAISDVHVLFSLATLSELVGPILLTIFFLPYLYGVTMFITYASAFRRLHVQVKDESLRQYAHFHAIVHFNVRLELLRRWARNVGAQGASSKQDIRRSILEVFETRQHERNPAPIAPADGWSPHIARHFLDEHGMPTQDYHRAAGEMDYWWTQSTPIEIDGTLPKDALFLYIEGTQHVAKQLKLALGIWNKDPKLTSRRTLLDAARILVRKATGEELPELASDAVLAGGNCQIKLAGKALIVQATMDDGATLDRVSLILRAPDWNPPFE